MIPAQVNRLLAPLFKMTISEGWNEYPPIYEPVRKIACLLREAGISIPIGMGLDWIVRLRGEEYYPYLVWSGMSKDDLVEVEDQFDAWRGAHLKPPNIVDLTDGDERMSQRELDELHPGYEEQVRELHEAQDRPKRTHEPGG